MRTKLPIKYIVTMSTKGSEREIVYECNDEATAVAHIADLSKCAEPSDNFEIITGTVQTVHIDREPRITLGTPVTPVKRKGGRPKGSRNRVESVIVREPNGKQPVVQS